jgi:hypothetical protein
VIRQALPLALGMVIFFAGVTWTIHDQMEASCERVNVLRDVQYQFLKDARDARKADGDTDVAAKYDRGLRKLTDVPFTNSPDRPWRVDCPEAFNLWPF